jgi:dihydrofolate reductase
MQQLTVIESVTLDGVMQGPGRADEDTRDGFRDGGWAVPYGDEVLGRAMGERMGCGGALVLGRRTYEDFAGYWPGRSDNPFTPVLDAATKHVASRTLSDPLPWRNSVLLGGDAGDAVAALKREPGPGIGVLGSGDLVRTLMARGLVDELLLLIHPLVLGRGRRLFADGMPPTAFRLASSAATSTGVIMATLRPADRQEDR